MKWIDQDYIRDWKKSYRFERERERETAALGGEVEVEVEGECTRVSERGAQRLDNNLNLEKRIQRSGLIWEDSRSKETGNFTSPSKFNY